MSAVTVVIPLYNKGQCIGRALDSIFRQTFQNFEVVVVDGGSEDDGPEVVFRYGDPRVRFLLQEGKGVSSARNQGIQAARSSFVAFLDADDEWLPGHLQTLLELRERYPKAGAYAAAWKVCSTGGNIERITLRRVPPPPWEGLLPSYFTAAPLSYQPVWTSAVGIPKHVLKEIGCFPPSISIGEDLITWFKIALRYPIAFTWRIGAIYHMEAENRTAKEANSRLWEEDLLDIVREIIRTDGVPADITHDVQEFIAGYQITIASKALSLGDPYRAQRALQECSTRLFRRERMKYMLIASLPPPLLRSFFAWKKR